MSGAGGSTTAARRARRLRTKRSRHESLTTERLLLYARMCRCTRPIGGADVRVGVWGVEGDEHRGCGGRTPLRTPAPSPNPTHAIGQRSHRGLIRAPLQLFTPPFPVDERTRARMKPSEPLWNQEIVLRAFELILCVGVFNVRMCVRVCVSIIANHMLATHLCNISSLRRQSNLAPIL